MRNRLEHLAQVQVIRWVKILEDQYPVLKLFHAIPNGGRRSITTARDLKAEGVRAGMPDLHLPVARGGWAGLWIEMKSEKGRVSPEQAAMHKLLTEHNNLVIVCRSSNQAIDEIKEYLSIKNPNI